MKERITQLIEEALPLVDITSDFFYDELDSLGITNILMMLSEEYGVELSAADATPRNFMSIDAIVAMVQKKLAEKA